MKKRLIGSFCSLLVLSFVACSKNDNATPAPTPTPTPTPTPVPATVWSWKETKGGVEASFTADSAFMNNGYKTFIVYKNNRDTATRRFFEVNLTGDVVGTYDLSTQGNALTYLTGSGGSFQATAGTFKITAAANSKWTGEFSATGTGNNGVTAVSGTFKDIPGR